MQKNCHLKLHKKTMYLIKFSDKKQKSRGLPGSACFGKRSHSDDDSLKSRIPHVVLFTLDEMLNDI